MSDKPFFVLTNYKGTDVFIPAYVDGKKISLHLSKGLEGDSYASRTSVENHTDNLTIHMLASEHQELQRLVAMFPDVVPDIPTVVEPSMPSEALSHNKIISYFANNAQPGFSSAPSTVYVSRVPLAFKDADGVIKNDLSEVDEIVHGASKKFLDNANLSHSCSTDKIEGVDDYRGKWAFHWQRGNYIVDEYGIKHLTAIEGQEYDGHIFDDTKQVCSFGPTFWFFVKEEKYQDPATGLWLTEDGTETGNPKFQLWGISSRSWTNLDEERRTELLAHGVTENDFHVWSECQQYDAENDIMITRPYWIHSAYCGGYGVDDFGSTFITSKRNTPLYNNLSHNTLNSLYGNKGGFGGSAAVQGFGILFDIVKNATKNSQLIHMGMSSNGCSAIKAKYSTAEADYVFPISSQGNFCVGGTVWLWQTNANSTSTTPVRSISVQIGRISAIENRDLLLEDGTTATSLCLIIDPDTVEPFLVRTGATNDEAISATKSLTDAGQYACCFATQGMALSGETDLVIGKHDGSCTSLTDGKHPYRVQGTEYMPGIWMCASDVVAIKGNGSTEVTIDGVVYQPTSSEYVYLQVSKGIPVKTSGSLAQYIDAGYKPIAIGTTTGGFILNTTMTPSGVVYPTLTGGSDKTGHGDNFYVGASPAEFLSGGHLNYGSTAGSSYLALNYGLLSSSWLSGGRD